MKSKLAYNYRKTEIDIIEVLDNIELTLKNDLSASEEVSTSYDKISNNTWDDLQKCNNALILLSDLSLITKEELFACKQKAYKTRIEFLGDLEKLKERYEVKNNG